MRSLFRSTLPEVTAMADAWIYSRTRTDAEELSRALTELGFTARHVDAAAGLFPSGRDGAQLRRPELAIVDRAVLVHEIRASERLCDVPVLVVAEPEELGDADEITFAHELVVRPFSLAELETRVARATSRRRHGVLRAGRMIVDATRREAVVDGAPVPLTYMEFELLRFLVSHPNRAFTREALLSRVWGYDYYGGARTVDVHVQRVRAKLGAEHARLIRTIRNVGYLLEPPRAVAA
jgi:DNA-binding response OmpR family regulator